MSEKKDTVSTKVIRGGQVHWESVTKTGIPKVDIADATGMKDFSKIRTTPANSCIYCGSKEQLSREHILPFALGGKTTIPKGSCECCRNLTQEFENDVLSGPMKMVRYIQDLPSRTKYKKLPKTIPVQATINGEKVIIKAPRDEAPIMLFFPLFEPPGYLEPGKTSLQLKGTVGGSFGADPNQFGKKHGAQSLEITENNNPHAFARMLAKIAYGDAYANNLLGRLKNKDDLVHAMLYDPNKIGRFVGTKPDESYKKYPGVLHRISSHIVLQHRLLYSEIQLFSGAGAPSYIVVLGTLKDDAPMDNT